MYAGSNVFGSLFSALKCLVTEMSALELQIGTSAEAEASILRRLQCSTSGVRESGDRCKCDLCRAVADVGSSCPGINQCIPSPIVIEWEYVEFGRRYAFSRFLAIPDMFICAQLQTN
jgi:hypothetical protein